MKCIKTSLFLFIKQFYLNSYQITPLMKVLVFAGSNNSASINKQLAQYAASLIENAQITVLDLNDFEMPIYSADREKATGIPPQTSNFLQYIAQCDLIVTSMAENNGNFSAAFKNLFDWSSRAERFVFQEKPMLLMATSPGARGGMSVLDIAQTTFARFGAQIKATFSLPSFFENFDVENQKISNEKLDQQLKEIIQSL